MIGASVQETLRALPVFDIQLPEFNLDQVPPAPDQLFLEWLRDAVTAGVREPHAMTLSTVDAGGRPNSRVLILKDIGDRRWGFATSRTSPKGRELEARPWAALAFYWPEVGRQIRIRGQVIDAGPGEAARDFLARSPASRTQAWAKNQSAVLGDPADLEATLAHARAVVQADPQATPKHWARYDVLADEVEFWQADRERCHRRLRYTLTDGVWRHDRLWP